MSDVTETQVDETNESAETQLPDEKSLLLQRARMMGLKVSNNSSVETLRAKIAERLEAERVEEPTSDEEETVEPRAASPAKPAAVEETPAAKPLTPQQFRRQLIQEATKLVRLRIVNLDPKKKDLPGEIFTVANEFVGTIRKYVPFGEATDDGYHVPHCIYEMLKDRKFLHIRVTKVNGREVIKTSWEREFALEVLPQLTEKELRQLAAAQAAKAGDVE